MQRPVSIYDIEQKINPMQRVKGEVASVTNLYNFSPLEDMVLIIKKKQNQ